MSDERAPGFRGRCTQCGAQFLNHCTDPKRPSFVVSRSCHCPRPLAPRQTDAHRFVALGGFDLERGAAVQERCDALIAARLVQLHVARRPWDATAWKDAQAAVQSARAAVLESVTFALERIGSPEPTPTKTRAGLATEKGWRFGCDCPGTVYTVEESGVWTFMCHDCGVRGVHPTRGDA